jgi:hypothetical protein
MRQIVLLAALAMIALFAFLTLDVAAREGVDVLTVLSIVVLAMFGFGIVGALRHPPGE